MSEATATGDATSPSGATPDAGNDLDGAGATLRTGGDDLGDAGKRALAEVRKELRTRDAALAERDARIAELENAGRSELERKTADVDRLTATLGERDARIAELEAQLADLDRNELRRDVASKAGIPDLWQRLNGATEQELAADAAALAERIGVGGRTPDLGAGARPGGTPSGGMDALLRQKMEGRR